MFPKVLTENCIFTGSGTVMVCFVIEKVWGVRPSVHHTFFCTCQNFRTEDHRDLVIGSNERSWFLDVPFDHFGQTTRPVVVKFAKNSGFHIKYI